MSKGESYVHSIRAANQLAAAHKLVEERDYGIKLSLDENCRQIIEALNSGAGG